MAAGTIDNPQLLASVPQANMGPASAPPQAAPAGSMPNQPQPAPPPQPGPTGQITRGQVSEPLQQGQGKNSKGTIPTPQTKPQFDKAKLAKANTPLDLLNAMTPSSRSDYMDEWEQQHGQINDHYDALMQQLGQRPTDQDLSKKEKFAALLEFGLHLLSKSGQPNQGAAIGSSLNEAVSDTQQAHDKALAGQQNAYDQQAQGIEQSRQDELKGLGTQTQAQQAESQQERDQAYELQSRAAAYKDIASTQQPGRSQRPTYSTAADGSLVALTTGPDGKPVAQPVLGVDGKPYKGRVLGASGSGIDKGDTAQIRNQKYLTSVLGIDQDTAAKIAFKVKTGDPVRDRAEIYKSVLSATLGDTDKATSASNQWVLENYGPQALANPSQSSPRVVPRPASNYDFSGLKAGYDRRMADGTVWTLGIDGKPTLVQGNTTNRIQ